MDELVHRYAPEGAAGRTVTTAVAAALTALLLYASAFLTSTGLYEGIPSRVVLGTLALGAGVAALLTTWQLTKGIVREADAAPDSVRPSTDDGEETPVEALRRRYAEGEIDEAEFERRLDALLSTEESASTDSEQEFAVER